MRGIMRTPINHAVRGLCLAALLSAGAPSAAFAADTDADKLQQLEQKLAQSIKMIDALAARVHELEAREGAGPAPAAAPAATAAATGPAPAAAPAAADDARLSAVEQKLAQVETANASHHFDDSSLPIHGFADINIGNHNPFFPYYEGTSLNNLDFYLTPQLGGRFVSLFELDFEVADNGVFGVDVERGEVGYQFSDEATLWVGRFHTPYGYVNTALHHGVWLDDALRRPGFLMFEDQGGILPAHTVGTTLIGNIRTDGGKWSYDVYLGNGQQIIGGQIDMRPAGNDHGKPAFGGRLGYTWTDGAAEGLTVGVHATDTRIDDDQLPEDMTEVRFYGGYVVYDTDRWEHYAEAYFFDNKDIYPNSGDHRSKAYFAQLGYRGLGWLLPYVRYERAELDQTDRYFNIQGTGGSYYRTASGVRHDITPRAAIKFELANTHYTDRIQGQINEVLGQLAIRF
jgi:hypothetical protein